MMSMPDGSRWAAIAEAARMHRVRVETIRVWATRGLVRTRTLLGRTYVCLDDVSDSDLAWRRRHAKKRR